MNDDEFRGKPTYLCEHGAFSRPCPRCMQEYALAQAFHGLCVWWFAQGVLDVDALWARVVRSPW